MDGGYFENSGIVTAMDVVDTIESAFTLDPELAPLRDRVEVDVISLNSKDFSVRDFYGLGEVLEPVRTMLSTRSARAPIETSRARLLLNEHRAPISTKLLRFDLSGLTYPLPLGWRLSLGTRELISNQLGFRQACLSAVSTDTNPQGLSLHCPRELLLQQLAGG